MEVLTYPTKDGLPWLLDEGDAVQRPSTHMFSLILRCIPDISKKYHENDGKKMALEDCVTSGVHFPPLSTQPRLMFVDRWTM